MAQLGSMRLLAISFVVIAVILIGDAVATLYGHSDYSAEVAMGDDSVDVIVSVEGTELYSLLVSENGDYTGVTTLYVYLDGSRPSPVPYRTQARYLEDLETMLATRGITDVVYVDAERLGDALIGSTMVGGCVGKGLVVVSGALPDTVYTGKSVDPIFQWMSAGGTLYWAGGLIGERYATEDRLVSVVGYERLFFGSPCLNRDDASVADDKDDYTEMLSLASDDLSYAVDVDGIRDGRKALGIGYSGDGYTSVSLVQFGRGMVCVLAGECDRDQRCDMAQVIASGIGPATVVVGYETVSVTGYEERTVSLQPSGGNLTAYVYIGEGEVLYGSLFVLEADSSRRPRGRGGPICIYPLVT